jgi:hypothetical protein
MIKLPEDAKIQIKNSVSGGWKILYVNGIKIGECSTTSTIKSWLDPKKWAEKKFKDRMETIDRNLTRIALEETAWVDEKLKLCGIYE